MRVIFAGWVLLWAMSASAQVLVVKRTDGSRTQIPVSEIADLRYESSVDAPRTSALLIRKPTGSSTRIPLIEIASMHYDLTLLSISPGLPRDPGGAGLLLINPGPGSARIEYAAKAAGVASISVLDVKGRRVRGLEMGPINAGNQVSIWDYTDGSGRRVDRGLYVIGIEAGGRSVSSRLLIVK